MDKAHIYQQSQRLASYALLPGIIPRIKAAAHTPFRVLSGLFADIMVMAGLLPANHAYVQPGADGTFGMLDVLRASGVRLKFDLRHIDQVIVYIAVLAAFITIWCFLGLAILYLAMTPAFASPNVTTSGLESLMASIYNATDTARPSRDAALMLLDRTLGVMGNTSSGSFFGSDIPNMCAGGDLGRASNPNCPRLPFPSPFNTAVLTLLQFYATAIFMFAVLFLLYLLATVVIEVSMKGKPFGERFNPFWTPLRLVVGIGLLIPLSPQGLNSAQYIVLYTAKISSAFATNGWLYYHGWLGNPALMGNTPNPIGLNPYDWNPKTGPTISGSSPLAAKLNAPDISEIVRFFHLVASCEYYYESNLPGINVQGYFTKPGKAPMAAYSEPAEGTTAAFVSYADALKYYDNGTIRVVFGAFDQIKYPENGGLKKLCGELVIPVTSVKDKNTGKALNPGAAYANEYYYIYTMALWDKSTWFRKLMDGFAAQMVTNYTMTGPEIGCALDTDKNGILNDPGTGMDLRELASREYVGMIDDQQDITNVQKPCTSDPPSTYMNYQIQMFQTIFQAMINGANAELSNPENFRIDDKVLDRGWAGAGIWFQNIALMNGAYVTAVQQMPYGAERPVVMDHLRSQILQAKPNIQNPEAFCGVPQDAGKTGNEFDNRLAIALCRINLYLKSDANDLCFIPDERGPVSISGVPGYAPEKCAKTTDNLMMRLVNTIFGTQFIFRFEDNSETHPLTQLVTFGRALLETSARNLMTGSAIAAAGGVTSLGNEDMGSSLKKIGHLFGTVASLMFSAGFMLYYVLPMLPFVYFFFAMLSWVKAVFEALIGAPLWAAAHLSLDDKDLVPNRARAGYLLLLEILLRPIITVFALIAAMGIFTAIVLMIHELLRPMLFNLGRPELAADLSGGKGPENMKDMIDRFFFTILYILIMYMTAVSSFKLIDMIPNQFMRGGGWFSGAKSFANVARDAPSEKFTSNTYVAVGNPLQGLIDKADEMSAEWAKAGVEVAGPKAKESVIGMVQQVFGKDRKTRAAESIKDFLAGDDKVYGMSKKESAARKDLKDLNKLLASSTLTDNRISKIEQDIEIKKMEIAVHNADRILMEVMQTGSSGIDRTKLPPELAKAFDDNIAAMKEEIKKTRPLVWQMLQGQVESQGGTYANNAMVDQTIKAMVAEQRKGIRAAMKNKGAGE